MDTLEKLIGKRVLIHRHLDTSQNQYLWATLEKENDMYMLTDVKSANATSTLWHSRHLLLDGDIVVINGQAIKYEKYAKA